jgi:arabinogalactan oligomer / maltooligosaccharide transport system permease protein
VATSTSTKPTPSASDTHHTPHDTGTTRPSVLIVRLLCIGVVLASAVALTPQLVGQGRWGFLAAVWAIALVVGATYITRRGIPAKYLLPGTLLLVTFVVYPVVATAQISTTNLADGTRGTKEQTIARIVGSSVQQLPDSPRYNLAIGTQGTPTTGPFAFFLVAPESGDVFQGTEEGLEPLDEGDVTVTDGFVTEPPAGWTLLTPSEVNDAGAALSDFSVPTDDGAIRQLGIRQAFEGRTTLTYDEATDTITNTQTGETYTAQQVGDREYFVDDQGNRVADQSWQANVGLDNYVRILTDNRILGDFLRIFAWTFVFATMSVVLNFALGLLLAVTLNDPRVRGQRWYRAILLLPYAIPGFIALLLWSSFYNRDFGLINDLLGLDVNWFGNATTAKIAVLLTNLWMGFPYMFLVSTGALQGIPGDLKEAANIDGAGGFYGFRKITFPLLLVGVAPLLVATFAFNFNNYNTIALLTEGGPFTPDNPTAGGTDILISYTIRLAFGTGGAEIGFASAISVLLFVLTGVIAAVQFRLTRRLEDLT